MDTDSCFDNFTRYAFRLETRPQYIVPEEVELLKAFKEKRPLPQGFNEEWVDLISSAISRGAVMQRLRLLSQPRTNYEEFEIEAYQPGLRAGEDIRIAPRGASDPLGDFWAFDDQWYLHINYADDGTFLGMEPITWDADIGRKVSHWRNVFTSEAKALTT